MQKLFVIYYIVNIKLKERYIRKEIMDGNFNVNH